MATEATQVAVVDLSANERWLDRERIKRVEGEIIGAAIVCVSDGSDWIPSHDEWWTERTTGHYMDVTSLAIHILQNERYFVY